MFFLPLWRGGQAEPSPGGVTQHGVNVLQQVGATDASQHGANVLQGLGRTRVSQVLGLAGVQGLGRSTVTQIAAVLIYIPTELPPTEPEPATCVTAPPVITPWCDC